MNFKMTVMSLKVSRQVFLTKYDCGSKPNKKAVRQGASI